jgi:cobalt-precorrin-5B (C1)-methyltransferase
MSKRPSQAQRKELRRGWTTGACATAATAAAYTALLTGEFPDPVTITLPKGETPSFALARESLADGAATAGIIKDAGDDPDVTHGALIVAELRHAAPGSGISFRAGPGVGTVTKAGLPVAVGEPAINPVPRRLMTEAVREISTQHGASGDVVITISVAGGEEMAKHTWNPRLGIVGGISILGTTGIVHPFSCSAWIASIHRGIDVARANSLTHIAACTGSTSEAGVQRLYDLPEVAYIDMGDFAGGMLKYLRRHPVARLTIGGGFGKLSKLAAGFGDLHSGRSQVDRSLLAELLADLGAPTTLIDQARKANTANEILGMARAAGLTLADRIAERARDEALKIADNALEIEVIVFDREGQPAGRAPFAAGTP